MARAEHDTPIAEPRGPAAGRGWPWRLVASGILVVVVGLGGLHLFGLLARPLGVTVLAIALAEAMRPAVAWLERRLPDTLAILLPYMVLLLAAGGLGWLIVPTFAEQVRQASQRLPEITDQLQTRMERLGVPDAASLLQDLPSQIGDFGSVLVSVPLAIVASLFDIVLLLVISIYWLLDGPKLRDFGLSLLPAEQRDRTRRVWSEMGQAMGGYVRGAAINGVVVAVLTTGGLQLIGVPFPLILGVLAGVAELLPLIGPVAIGLVIVAVAALESTTTALIALVFVVVMQQLESYLLVPLVMRRQTDISSLLVILAIFGGSAVGGVLGALVAIPLVAVMQVFVIRVIAPAVRRRTRASPPPVSAEPS